MAFTPRFLLHNWRLKLTALGLSVRGKIPFVSSFAAFLTRAADQIRMSQYSGANIKFCGSHAGVSIGEDGSSQMGLEDLSLFRFVETAEEAMAAIDSWEGKGERDASEAEKALLVDSCIAKDFPGQTTASEAAP